MTLVYPSGDFSGYLTAVLETWVHRSPEWGITANTGDWFDPEGPHKTVVPDLVSARRVWSGVEKHAGPGAAQVLADAFRHADRGKEALLAEYIRLCIRHRVRTLDRLVDPEVRETLRRARAVRSEAHRCLGLVRFQSISGGGWYAKFGPDHDVLGLLVDPFQQRLGGQDWMLHDVRRRSAWVCRDGYGAVVSGVVLPGAATGGPREPEIQDLWRKFFMTAAIPGKENSRLQQNRMPAKTWKYLVEAPGSGVSLSFQEAE